jgi:hypothetical protein
LTEYRLRHIVLAALSSDESIGSWRQCVEELRTLPQRTKVRFTQFEAGGNLSLEGMSGGLNVGFSMVFASAPHRDAYLAEPEHRRLVCRLVQFVAGGLAGQRVFDMRLDEHRAPTQGDGPRLLPAAHVSVR